MKTKSLLLVAVMLMCVGSRGNAQALIELRHYSFPIENLLFNHGQPVSLYDFYTAPHASHATMMGVKGEPKSLIQSINVMQDYMYYNKGQYVDTLSFNAQGGIVELRSQTLYDDSYYVPNRVEVKYNPDGTVDALSRYTIINNMGKPQQRYDLTQLVYDNGKLKQEIYNMYYRANSDVEWSVVDSFNNTVECEYTYVNNRLSTAKLYYCDHIFHYDADGYLQYIGNNKFKPVSYTYNANKQIVSIISHVVDEGMDETDYYRSEMTLTRNQHGDIVKVVEYQHPCTSKWVVKGKGKPQTHHISYTYDTHGNWTQATISRGKVMLLKVNRNYTY